MLKRYQVLLNDWLAEHMKEVAEKYDVSFSEILRVSLCLQTLKNISEVCPKCSEANMDKLMKQIIKKKNHADGLDPAQMHKFLSDLYFETRKAIECWGKKPKNKKAK